MSSGINIKPKADYTSLFQSMSGGGVNLNFLSDYASIKNGSYGKLMKAYYAKTGDTADPTAKSPSVSTSKDSTKTLAKVQTAADNLKDSADALIATGSKSVFSKKDVTVKDEAGNQTTKKDYDKEAIYKSVSSFVNDYNAVIDKTGDAKSNSVLNKTLSLVKMTDTNKKLLSGMGITINSDHTLSINKEDFQKADMANVKSLFNGTGSYAYRVSAQASLIGFAADSEASKSNTYQGNGSYSNNYSAGNIMDSLF